MSKRKKIDITKNLTPKSESSKSYFEDIKTVSEEKVVEERIKESPKKERDPSRPVKKALPQTSVFLGEELAERVEKYIYHKRVSGDVYYSKKDMFKEALDLLIERSNI